MSQEQFIKPKIELNLPEGEKELFLPTPEQSVESNVEKPIDNPESDINDSMTQAREIIKEETEKDNPNIAIPEQNPKNNYIDQNLQNIQTKQLFNNIRHYLPILDKQLSKVIHQPVIEEVSDKTSKTIARSSGVLGGSILAFVGSLSYLIFVKYVGITYNYTWVFIFFIIGFIVGLAIELLIRTLISKN